MQTKLTLRLDSELIAHAKQYSEKTDKSLSQLVADYFALLDKLPEVVAQDLPPITRSLQGALDDANISEKEYKKYLEDKHL